MRIQSSECQAEECEIKGEKDREVRDGRGERAHEKNGGEDEPALELLECEIVTRE